METELLRKIGAAFADVRGYVVESDGLVRMIRDKLHRREHLARKIGGQLRLPYMLGEIHDHIVLQQ
ncbi:MAG: hypothetical protein IJ138_03720, partial [Clostridia bacterium]|nr:hypothetical protein [Clostridia bacterium]